MKTNRKPDGLRTHRVFAIAMIFVTAISLFSCSKCDDEEDIALKPAIVIKPAERVGIDSATLVAKLVPYEKGTTVSFEYRIAASWNWQVMPLPLDYTGQDSIAVTLKLTGLTANTKYSFRAKASNAGGDVTTLESTFETYAVSDCDGNLYHTVTIGTQTWLRENLRATHYANGESISHITNPEAWGQLTTGAYCWYDNDPKNGKVYGALYNWYVGANNDKVLIDGWHVPTVSEWWSLVDAIKDPANPLAQVDAMYKLLETGSLHWKPLTGIDPRTSSVIVATNSSGFTALPSGAIAPTIATGEIEFMNLHEGTAFWSSELFGPGAATGFVASYNYSFVGVGAIYPQKCGFSVRLISD